MTTAITDEYPEPWSISAALAKALERIATLERQLAAAPSPPAQSKGEWDEREARLEFRKLHIEGLYRNIAILERQVTIAQNGEQTWSHAHRDATRVAELAECRANELTDQLAEARAIIEYHAYGTISDKIRCREWLRANGGE